MEKILFLSLGAYRNEAIRTCCGRQILLQASITLFTILDDATVVEVVLLATLLTSSNAAGVHRNRIVGTDGIVLTTHTVGTLHIVGRKTTKRLGIQNLETYDDAVVDANHKLILGLLLHSCFDLLAGLSVIILEVQVFHPTPR